MDNLAHNLYEQFRPAKWDQILGQEKIVSQLQRLIEVKRIGGNAFWFSGKSGTGKTSIARLLAQEIADPFNIHEELARHADQSTLDGWRKCRTYGMGEKNGRAYILNEAHGLNMPKIEMLLGALEEIPPHVVWIFTTTNDGQSKLFSDYDDAAPLLSRCKAFKLSDQGLAKVFATRIREIAVATGLGNPDENNCIRLVNRCKGNFRAALQALEMGELN